MERPTAAVKASCRLYWKERWLRPSADDHPSGSRPTRDDPNFEELARLSYANVSRDQLAGSESFRCQTTELPRASAEVSRRGTPWSLLTELVSRNVTVGRSVGVVARAAVHYSAWRLGLRPRRLAMPYDPTAEGFSPPPLAGLHMGQLVRVRSRREIARTLGPDGKTRGLWFDREMLAFCGQTFRVRAKIERFVDEATGRLVTLKTDCYSLENVVCSGDASPGRHLVPPSDLPVVARVLARAGERRCVKRQPPPVRAT